MASKTTSLFPHGYPADVVESLDTYRDRETQHFARQLAEIDATIGTAPSEQLDALRWHTLGRFVKWMADRPRRIERRLTSLGLAPEPELTAFHQTPADRAVIQQFAAALRSLGTDLATRTEIAETAGATPRMVLNWQNGENGPRLEHVVALAERYDVAWNVLARMADRAPRQIKGAA